MSEDKPPTLDELRRECHAILGAIAKKPQAYKLLLGLRDTLRTYVAYKAAPRRSR